MQFFIKRTPWSRRRILTIDPQFMELEGFRNKPHFTKEDIDAFRFGVSGFRYFFFPLSRTYTIEIKSDEKKKLLVRMHSFFGFGNKKIESLFIQIQKQIHQTYFNDMAIHYVRLLNHGLTYELGGAFLSKEGVFIRKGKAVIPWAQVGIKSYFESCSIYDQSDPLHCRSFDYWHDWNASLLHTVVKYRMQNIQVSGSSGR